ncbi:serine protease [Amycolatopsis suaedae]|uniref:Serine protease n=1 Tax=Amycolatopsis suaedae TaxID=2510978 RepID=A0A4Q7JBT9_9PSEU|nr:serine protease [Amycolatopsis suaedae]RZQ64496.1 serine protease [Amycolatopsis suaedae]
MIENNMFPEEYAPLAAVQAETEADLLARQNVVGVALGTKYTGGTDTGERAITVLVDAKLPRDTVRAADLVPAELSGFQTDVQEVGVLQAGTAGLPTAPPKENGALLATDDTGEVTLSRPDEAARQQAGPYLLAKRFRPAFGGVSVGHFKITAGTFGTAVYDTAAFPGKPARYYILSNNHVLANSNAASIGDPILQPGPFDGGTFPADTIARLSRFVPIKFIQAGQPIPLNFVDAAIAEGQFHDLDRRIYWVGDLRGVNAAPAVGTVVQKTGRTTNWTTGRITNINATVDVNYGGGKVARFAQQLLTTDMSAGGDSGSLVADLDGRAVGLLFAGSPVVTVVNRIALVQALLGIRVHP